MNGFNDNKWDEIETERLSKSGHMTKSTDFVSKLVSLQTDNYNLQGTPGSTQLSKIFRMSVKCNMTLRGKSTISFYCGKSHVVGRATPSKLINAGRFTYNYRMFSPSPPPPPPPPPQQQQLHLSKLVVKEFFTLLNKHLLVQTNLSETYKLKHASKTFII
jgi:hypothetical protein